MADISSDVAFRISQTGAETVAENLAKINTQLDRTATSSGRTGQGIQQLHNITGRASYTMLNFSRIIQDLPYGFFAIANNINPAVESLGTLREEITRSGQKITVLRAMLNVLSGPAGLGLLVGVISSTIIALPRLTKIFGESGEAAKESAKQFERWKKALTDLPIPELNKELEQAEKVFGGKAAQGAVKGVGWTGPGALMQGIYGLFAPSTEEAKKKVDAIIDALGEAYNKQDKAQRGIINAQEYKIKLIEEEIKQATTLEEIARRTKELEHEKIRLSIMQRGVSPEALYSEYTAGLPYLRGGKTPQQLLKYGRTFAEKMEPKRVNLKEEFSTAKLLETEIAKINLQEMHFLGLLDQGVGTLRSALGILGVETDSFIGKLLQGLDVAMSIMRVIQGFSALGSFLSIFNPISIPMGGITTPGPIGRRALTSAIKDAGRLGYFG